ncbi:glycosyl hydrolase [Microbacterium telephonicum]|uniref:Mannan endo-1,4-beta-mannosidase n=1 Tax=Microbacterium telephonicum TaxID=1714841 RepID=A0A498BVQ8_9MICO|nr:glycosyl hydrolase [Microbacterium telephonicum]RLK46456.1 mannan endo-1,4-beta-mannosidase [Microbacterium telephonicum]
MKSTLKHRMTVAIAAVIAATICVPATAGVATANEQANTAAEPAAVDLVDAEATPETRSLFAYLRDLGGQGVLFGHQEDLYFGSSFGQQDGWSSDVLAATGDHPAVIGFDTLETAGMALAEREAKALVLAENIQQAHAVGAVSTMTVHLENLATGGDFYDTTGDPLRAVLPGGSHHDELRAYLDRFAVTAQNAVDEDGNPIPIIFRPWHENAGSWFWWGAAFGTPGEYAELFRFTVEYLRDVKGVHNLLYAFSPGGGFGGDAATYLRTYPGDDFVDVLGYDTYDDTGASQSFLDSLVADLAMLGDLAAERGKISAFTEFGISGGVRPDGDNKNINWYTDVLNAIRANPSAANTAYMLTWANYGGTAAPYTPVAGEMLPDFLDYHANPSTLFADDLTGIYDRRTTATASAVTHLASPADAARVVSGPVELRASVTGFSADRVTVTVDDADGEIELAAPGDGELWWTGVWNPAAEEFNNSTRLLTVHVYSGGSEVDTVQSSVVLGPEPTLAPGVVDDFETYSDEAALSRNWVPQNVNTLALVRSDSGGVVGGGDSAMRMSYSFASQSYTGIGRRLQGDWSTFGDFTAWIDPDASGNKLVLQLVADGVAFEAYPSLSGEEPYQATIPFADWRPAPWDTANAERRLDAATLRNVTQFSVFINAVDGAATEGSVVLDELRAVPGPPPAPVYPDVPLEDPDHEAVKWLHDEVVDLAGSQGRFQPHRKIDTDDLAKVLEAYRAGGQESIGSVRGKVSRLEFAGILWNLAGEPTPAADGSFKDVKASHPNAAAVAWVTESGVVEPAKEERFGASLLVTRAELARWLFRFDQLPGLEPPVVLFDFEDGVQGWHTNGAGTVSAAEGSLLIDLPSADWVGSFGGWNLAGRTTLSIDIPNTTGTEIRTALQLGSSWSWCEPAPVARIDGPRTGDDAVVIDLSTLSEECQNLLGDVRGVNLYLDAGQHQIEAVTAR